MNIDQKVARNINSSAEFTLEEAFANGYARKIPTGFGSTVGDLQLIGPKVRVKLATGEITEDGIL